MQQLRSRSIVLAGVGVALLGAVMVFVYARSVTRSVAGEAAVTAYVATSDIPAGTRWEAAAQSVARRSVPASLRPDSAVTSPDQLTGRTSVRGIGKGEVVTAAQFGAGVSAPASGLQIPPGQNAVTVNLPAPRGVAYYAQPADLVNVYTTLQGPDGQQITKLILSNVQVLANRAAGTPATSTVPGGGEVLLTLALTPDQSERLIFAREQGSLWFGLVRPGDEPAVTGGRTTHNVLS